MRLLGHFTDEKLAYQLHYFLLQKGIQNSYDIAVDQATQEKTYHIWIIEEEDMTAALEWLQKYEPNPHDVQFHSPQISPEIAPRLNVKIDVKKKHSHQRSPLTLLIIILCSILFLINSIQQETIEKKQGKIALQLGVTPLQKNLLFDYPQYLADMEKFYEKNPVQSIEDIKALPQEEQADYQKVVTEPTWKGAAELITERSLKGWEDLPPGVFFGKIRQGEFWRLFTPCLLHNGIFHILFNMCWVWVLGKQIEERLGKLRMFSVVLLAGVIANCAQYIMGGPIFEGFSGVVIGLVAFIWMRQKIAPWEGYPLQRSVILFITIYVFAMLGLEILSFILHYFHIVELVLPIANTAHVIGGVVGLLCARLPFFARGKKI